MRRISPFQSTGGSGGPVIPPARSSRNRRRLLPGRLVGLTEVRLGHALEWEGLEGVARLSASLRRGRKRLLLTLSMLRITEVQAGAGPLGKAAHDRPSHAGAGIGPTRRSTLLVGPAELRRIQLGEPRRRFSRRRASTSTARRSDPIQRLDVGLDRQLRQRYGERRPVPRRRGLLPLLRHWRLPLLPLIRRRRRLVGRLPIVARPRPLRGYLGRLLMRLLLIQAVRTRIRPLIEWRGRRRVLRRRRQFR